MKSNTLLYSIQTHPESEGLLTIETVVSGGVYNFSILGINQRSASDVKSRVYIALRTEGLLNLKSDNRKITVNLISDTEDIIASSCELGIALSCIGCISGSLLEEPLLAIGSLSITGTIIPSNKLLQALYVAQSKGIRYIACSEQDIQKLDRIYITHATRAGLRFFTGQTLKEIVSNIRNFEIYRLPDKFDQKEIIASPASFSPDEAASAFAHLKKDTLSWAIFISLCGRHDLMIETNKSVFFDGVLALAEAILTPLSVESVLAKAHMLKIEDSLVFEILKKLKYCTLERRAPKKLGE